MNQPGVKVKAKEEDMKSEQKLSNSTWTPRRGLIVHLGGCQKSTKVALAGFDGLLLALVRYKDLVVAEVVLDPALPDALTRGILDFDIDLLSLGQQVSYAKERVDPSLQYVPCYDDKEDKLYLVDFENNIHYISLIKPF